MMPRWFDALRTRSAAFVHDLLMVPLAWLGAYWVRANLGVIPEPIVEQAAWALLLVVPVQALSFRFFGLYRGVWRFASLPDLVRIGQSVLVGLALILALLFVLNRLEGVPRSVPPVYALLLGLFLAGPRLLYRWYKDRGLHLRDGKRVLIVGAGKAGEMLVRDMLRARSEYLPIAFVDDKPRRLGSEVHGVPVLGGADRLPRLTEELGIELVMLAVPSANAAQMRRLVEYCEQSGVPFRTVPQLQNLIDGQVSIAQVREVSINDLLGRDPVQLDWQGICAGLSGRRVMVTGAGGSIGSELCRQLLRARPACLIVVDQNEFSLYRLEQQLRDLDAELPLPVHLLDVTDRPAVDHLMDRERPDIVFHAAAYKHVPMLEQQVREAIRNNLFGTRVVADAAHRAGCREFVLISTDKAVNPSNVMGASKRFAEIYCQNLNDQSPTAFMTVRFGNVMGSSGSVIPLFRQQIERGGPVTLTHERVERFFMTIPEACQLIMQASVIGAGGEIFVLDMGKPVRIRYLAEQMIQLAGKRPGEDIAIEVVGLRPGEKLHEELFHDAEHLLDTSNPRIKAGRCRRVDWQALQQGLTRIEQASERMDAERLLAELKYWVPEWQASDHGIS